MEVDALFIESIYLIAAAGKLFHGPQEVRKAWMFLLLFEFKVCLGKGWHTSLLEILSHCCTHPIQHALTHGGDKRSTLLPHPCAPCYGELSWLRISVPVHHWSSLIKAGLLLPYLLIAL